MFLHNKFHPQTARCIVGVRTSPLSLEKLIEVQLNRLGGSQPLCSSQWRMAVPVGNQGERTGKTQSDVSGLDRQGLEADSLQAH